ncbi:hypothetical protein PTKIN_Ptkin14bG0135300 [Pterospermum kingtungense]
MLESVTADKGKGVLISLAKVSSNRGKSSGRKQLKGSSSKAKGGSKNRFDILLDIDDNIVDFLDAMELANQPKQQRKAAKKFTDLMNTIKPKSNAGRGSLKDGSKEGSKTAKEDSSVGFIMVGQKEKQFPKPFKFFNFWTKNGGFLDTVLQSWSDTTIRNPLKSLFEKLKRLKPVLNAFNKSHFFNVSERVQTKKGELKEIQQKIMNGHGDKRRVSRQGHSFVLLSDASGSVKELEKPLTAILEATVAPYSE